MKKIFEILRGFSLAEVLLAMTIIGIISVITIPAMITSVKKHEYATGVKKAQTIVTESFDSMKIGDKDEHVPNKIYETFNSDSNPATSFRNVYAKYFGMKSVFGPSTFDEYYYPLNDTTTNVNPDLYNGGGFLARNGMMVMVGKVPVPGSEKTSLIISVDVNGPKRGNNQLGMDVYSFEVLPSDNVLPVGARSTTENTTSFKYEDYCKPDTLGNNLNGIACTFSALNKAKYMDDVAAHHTCGECVNKGTKKGSPVWGCTYGWLQCDTSSGSCGTYKCVCSDESFIKNADGTCSRPDDNDNNRMCYLTTYGRSICCNTNVSIFDSNNQTCKCTNGGVGDNCDECQNVGEEKDSNGKCCLADRMEEIDDRHYCPCKEGQVLCPSSGQCIVNDPTGQRVLNQETCQLECQAGKTWVNTECCDNTLTLSGGDTINLKSGDNLQGCEYDCGEGLFSGSKWSANCTCKDKHATWSNGTCTCDIDYTTYKDNACVCNDGYKLQDDECVCLNGADPANNCNCSAELGLVAYEGGTTGACKCNTNKGFKQLKNSEGMCECANPHAENVSGTCTCKGSEGWTGNGVNCECDTKNHFVANGNACQCDVANGWEAQTSEGVTTCTCNGTIKNDGTCDKRCINGAVWNNSKGECECNVLYAELQGNGCVCKNNLTMLPNSNRCQCTQGSLQVSGGEPTCVAGGESCSGAGQAYVSASCLCQDGTVICDEQQYWQEHGENCPNSCLCPAGYTARKYKDNDGKIQYETSGVYLDDGTLYNAMLCDNDNCSTRGGTWTSTRGIQGSCECMNGMYADSSQTCQCYGSDVSYNDEYNTTTYDFNTDSSADYCLCSSSQLTYKKTGSSASSYGCVPNSESINIIDEDSLNNAKTLSGAYNFSLENNIEVDGKWTPWGTTAAPFKGYFDGKGHTITVSESLLTGDDYVGFFGFTSGDCKISNVKIVIEGDIEGKAFIGALVGYNVCEISNVTVKANNIAGEFALGGFVGANNGTIINSSVENVTVHQKEITKESSEIEKISDTSVTDNYKTTATELGYTIEGGFAGINLESGNISGAGVKGGKIATADEAETSVAGGFVGENRGIINKCSVDNTTQVGKTNTGNIYGGFAGLLSDNSITRNSFSQASYVRGNATIGGFAGYFENGTVTKSYSSTTDLTAYDVANPRGGFIGKFNLQNTADVLPKNCFYNTNNGVIPAMGLYNNETINESAIAKVLHGNTTDELKDPKKYICAQWGEEKDIWYYPTDDFPNFVDKTTCSASYYYPVNDGYQTKCLYCGYEEYFNGTECFAVSSYPDDENYAGCLVETKSCPAGQHYVDSSQSCVPCSATQTWDEETQTCKCPSDMTDDGMGGCTCSTPNSIYTSDSDKTGSTEVGSKCVACGNSATATAGECVCNDAANYTFDYSLGTCLPKCGDHYEYFDPANGCAPRSDLIDWDSVNKTYICRSTYTEGNSSFTLSQDIDLLLLSTCANENVGWTRGKSFGMSNNINMTDVAYTPVGVFEGTFSGNSYAIQNLRINTPDNDNVGLFSTVTSANSAVSIQNLTMYDFNITGKDNVGVIAGLITKGTNNISLSGVTLTKSAVGSITGVNNVGGIAGRINLGSALSLQSNTVGSAGAKLDITSTGTGAGGFAGYVDNTNYNITLRAVTTNIKLNTLETADCANGRAGLVGYANSSNRTFTRCTTNININYCPIP